MRFTSVGSRSLTSALAAAIVALCGSSQARGGGTTLELAFPDGIVCLAPGDVFRVLVEMSNIPPGTPAAGFQAFIEYDTAKVNYLTGNYPPAPFGLAIIPIAGPLGELNLAAGINQPLLQGPTTSDAVVAELFFLSIDGDGENVVRFRANTPGTTISAVGGDPIGPLTLIDLYEFSGNEPGDLDDDGVVDGFDLGLLLSNWGPCVPPNLECLGDLNCDLQVDGADLGILLSNWS